MKRRIMMIAGSTTAVLVLALALAKWRDAPSGPDRHATGAPLRSVVAATDMPAAGLSNDLEKSEGPLVPLARKCFLLDEIRGHRVLSDRRILLQLSDGTTAIARLKRACPQLLYHRDFRFEGQLGQVCAELDRVLTRAGMRCTIAGFYRVDSAPAGE
ncbi:MAG: hypothetical protein D6757_05775 [Alphaproteobacteria bacterium]|nr:MAG: hypothetical protein D6757_05775 [Alphaproteobacteria bacterium]